MPNAKPTLGATNPIPPMTVEKPAPPTAPIPAAANPPKSPSPIALKVP